jgi:hypothetical protein
MTEVQPQDPETQPNMHTYFIGRCIESRKREMKSIKNERDLNFAIQDISLDLSEQGRRILLCSMS